MFLIATRPSSALCRAVLMYSRRRSSVSSGSTILMIVPSLAGFTLRSLFLLARSMAASEPLSNGWMTTILGSGTWNEPSWISEVCVPYYSTLILLNMPGRARPVRMMLKSSLATETALSIFASASRSVSSIIVRLRFTRHALASLAVRPPQPARSCLILLPPIQAGDQRADLLAADGPDDVPLAHEREHHDRQPVVHAQADRRGIHHLQPAAEVLTVVQPLEPDRVRGGVRIRVVDAVDLGALEHGVGADLQRPLRGRGVGGEERGAQAGPEDHHAALVQVPDGPSRDIGLGHLAHGDGRLHPGLDAALLQHVLQGQAVDDRAEHAHVVGAGPVDTPFGQGRAAKHVAAADHRGDLHAVLNGGDDLRC